MNIWGHRKQAGKARAEQSRVWWLKRPEVSLSRRQITDF